MDNTVLLLPHQERFLQSPRNFPDIRWHFLLAGYGAGKTRSLAIAALSLISELDGEKDDGGLYAKIAVAGYTYAHLEQTFLIDFRAYLEASKTPYHEDTKDHIITVGTVQLILLQLSEPGKIFGQSIYAALADEVDELEEDVMIEAMKSLSQRVRQIMPGHRSPYVMAASTAQGMKGFYRLYSHYKKCGVGFVLVRARTQDNWYLPREYIEDLWKNFTETERKVYMEGEFLTVTQGRVIPNFDWDRNFAPESDMDLHLLPGERVFIGQDFNCLRGDTRILTMSGEVPIKDIRPGDYVLTRKGFRKVLTAVSRGVKIVYDFNGLVGTKDHVAITPKGDVELWKAESFYCLRGLNTSGYRMIRTALAGLSGLRDSFMMTSSGEGSRTRRTAGGCTSSEEGCSSTGMFTRSFMARFLRAFRCTTRTDAMTTDLRVLYACLRRTTPGCIMTLLTRLDGAYGPAAGRRFSPGMPRRKAGRIIRRWLRELGLKDGSAVRSAALIVEESLRRAYARRSDVPDAGRSAGRLLKGRATEDVALEVAGTAAGLLRQFVSYAESLLSERLRRSIARSIRVIGSAPAMNGGEAEVYDIEVEGEHEFFANGILVHNCGYSRASAWVSRDGCLHCVKYYDFPDVGDAPRVFRYDFPEQDLFWVPDVTSKDQYPHFARDLRKYDVHIIHRAKSPMVEDSCFLLSKLCLQGRLMIHSQASEVADAFATASRDKNNRIPKGVGVSSPIHAIDGARYACSYMALILPEYRDLRQGLMRHLASFRRTLEEDRDAPVRDKGAGYVQIEGTAFL